MKVILLRNVAKVGNKDQIVEVSDGYAHNALFPKKYAIPATSSAVVSLEKRLKGTIAQAKLDDELLEKTLQDLDTKKITLKARANEQGSLFARITASDIAKHLEKEYRVTIDPKTIVLKEDIKHAGKYTIPVIKKSFQGSFQLTIISS